MKINSPAPSVGTATASRQTRAPAASPQPSGSAGSERVDISSLSARLQEVGGAEAPANSQRVAEIKLAIAEGRFQIDTGRIADGLLASVRDMLNRANKPA